MAFAGLRGTGTWGTSERPTNFREFILWKNPNGSAPLLALMAKAAKEKVDDPQFSWWEEKLEVARVRVNYVTGYVSTDNTIIISSGGLTLVAGDVLQVEAAEAATYNNELCLVSSVTSDTVIVVKRGIAGTTNGAAMVHQAYLTKIGSAFPEGSTAPGVSLRNPTKLTNYCQIFKTAVGISRTAELTYARTGDAFLNDKKRKAWDHSVSLELAFMFGVAAEETSGLTGGSTSFPTRYTGGLRSFITTNSTIFTTSPTEDTFLAAVYKVFDYQSEAGDQRIVLAGNGFLNTLNKLARASTNSRINFDSVIKLYGMSLQRWILPQGELAVKTHPLMNLHGRYTDSAFVIDPTSLKYRYIRDTAFTDHVEVKKEDKHEALWLTEAGLEFQHEETNAYIGYFRI